jgi:glycosyltransferase involved in cell wall biosynthesis
MRCPAPSRGCSTTRRTPWRGIASPFSDSDIFILPSYNENCGIAVAEATACAIPVIVWEGANGRRLLTEQFRWDRVAARLHGLYESARRGRVEEDE